MGRKGKWFVAVKKMCLGSSPKEKKSNANKSKSRKKWRFGKSKHSSPPREPAAAATPPPVTSVQPTETNKDSNATPPPQPQEQAQARTVLPPPPPPVQVPTCEIEEVKESVLDSGHNKNDDEDDSVAPAPMLAATEEVTAVSAVETDAVTEVDRPAAVASSSGPSREETAAIMIQSAFRGYLARRALHALRGLDRLKSLTGGNAVRRQTANTLRFMQALTKVQSQIRSRRIRSSEENQSLQKQLQIKQDMELEKLKIGEDWDDSLQSKEQIEASILSKQEAAMRRERALAYAFAHQWKTTSRGASPTFMDANNPQWGWSSLERWAAGRPSNARASTDTGLADEPVTAKTASKSPSSRQSPSVSASPAAAKSPFAAGFSSMDEDPRLSSLSDRPRRHSVYVGSPLRDEKGLQPGASAVPRSYMQSTESVRAKSRLHSPVSDKPETPEKATAVSAKKRLSFSVTDKKSPAPSLGRPRRQPGPPKADAASAKDAAAAPAEQISASSGEKS